MAFADLPYGLKGTSMRADVPVRLDAFWSQLKIGLDAAAPVVSVSTQPFTTAVISSNLNAYKYGYVWEKDQATNFYNTRTQPLRKHEDISVFFRGKATYNPHMRHGFKPYICRRKGDTSEHFNKANRKPRVARSVDGTRFPVSILRFPRASSSERIHTTQKPVSLLDWLIRTYSNTGDNVLDPCSGSGTTAVAALACERNVVCIEKDEAYFEASVERVRKSLVDGGIDAQIEVRR